MWSPGWQLSVCVYFLVRSFKFVFIYFITWECRLSTALTLLFRFVKKYFTLCVKYSVSYSYFWHVILRRTAAFCNNALYFVSFQKCRSVQSFLRRFRCIHYILWIWVCVCWLWAMFHPWRSSISIKCAVYPLTSTICAMMWLSSERVSIYLNL